MHAKKTIVVLLVTSVTLAGFSIGAIAINSRIDQNRGVDIRGEANNSIVFEEENTSSQDPNEEQKEEETNTEEEQKVAIVEDNSEVLDLDENGEVVRQSRDFFNRTVLRANLKELDQEIYTNQFLPELKIEYPTDWSFRTATRASSYPGLIERDIILKKGGTTVTFTTRPYQQQECEKTDGVFAKPLLSNVQGLNIHRYDYPVQRGDYYASPGQFNVLCTNRSAFLMPSTIANPSFAQRNSSNAMGGGDVMFLLNVDVKGAQFVFEADGLVALALADLKPFEVSKNA